MPGDHEGPCVCMATTLLTDLSPQTLKSFHDVCVCVLSGLCVGLCMLVQCPQRLEKAAKSPEAGVTSSCELPDVGVGNQT